jgi:transcriptional regulator with XRE-family HTH domain
MTQRALADKSALHVSYISSIELGQRNPTWETLGSLAEAFSITIADLAHYTEGIQREAADLLGACDEIELSLGPSSGRHK